jgi:hypothetical protein
MKFEGRFEVLDDCRLEICTDTPSKSAILNLQSEIGLTARRS